MMVTRPQLERTLLDHRWHQVSTGAARWFFGDPRYEVEVKRFALVHRWQTATDALIGSEANMKYRVRMAPTLPQTADFCPHCQGEYVNAYVDGVWRMVRIHHRACPLR